MGCCYSVPDAPEVILPDPEGPCTFTCKKLGMFADDYVVLADENDKSSKWLFLNRQGGLFSGSLSIDLENFVRNNPDNPKKGEILWYVKFDTSPKYKREYDDDSSDDEFSDGGDYFSFMRHRRENHYAMKWKMMTEMRIEPGKRPGGAYVMRVKAKGTATRKVRYELNDEGHREKKYYDHERVKSVSYRMEQKSDGAVVDSWKIFGDLNRGRECHWDNVLFSCDEFRGVNRVQTKPGCDPSLSLLVAHICATEFDIGAIKQNFRPQWERMKFYHESPYDGSY